MSLLPDTAHQLGSCIKLLLLWLATSDGKLGNGELEYLDSLFSDSGKTLSNDSLLQLIREADLDSIELAIRTLDVLDSDLKLAFLDMAISMATADGRLAISENYLLRFYAEALGVSLADFKERYRIIVGRSFPEPGDPSRQSWWEQATGRQNRDPNNERGSRSSQSRSQERENLKLTEVTARAILGVTPQCSSAEIKRAYQRLAAIFHPDRVSPMGEDAVKFATERFKKIQQAYALLKT